MSPVNISAVEGNRQLLDGGAMFGNAPRPVWEKWIAPDSLGRIPLACRSLLIEFDNIKVLCETGIGAFFEPKLADRFGVQTPDRHLLLENLKKLGVDPENINYVILSHLHFDHAGGLLPTFQEMQQGQTELVFPNATFLVSDEAWARALHPHSRDKASFIPGLTDKLKATGKLVILPKDPIPEPLKGRFEFPQTHGHTPGHMHTLFTGEKQKVFFCGDLIPGQAWIHAPITMGYDRFPELLIDEKTKTYERAVKEHWLMFFTHDPFVAGSCVKKTESGKFEYTEPEETMTHRKL